MTTNPLDAIQARSDKGMAALADYGDGKRGVMSTMIRLTDTAEDAGKLVAALRAVEELLAYWDTLTDGDRYYAGSVRARIREALG